MKALIDLFWVKYTQLQHAVEAGDNLLIDILDREVDPLLKAIYSEKAATVADARTQFQFVLDLLQKETGDACEVMRYSETLRMLVDRYFMSREPGLPFSGLAEEEAALRTGRIKGRADEGLLNEAILESLPDRVAVITTDYRYLYANSRLAERLQEKPMRLVGRHIMEFVGIRRFEQRVKDNLDACFAGETLDYTFSKDSDGRTIVVRCRMTPCRSGTGKIIGAIIVLQEMANRRRAIAA